LFQGFRFESKEKLKIKFDPKIIERSNRVLAPFFDYILRTIANGDTELGKLNLRLDLRDYLKSRGKD
jgi:hypothetical protein